MALPLGRPWKFFEATLYEKVRFLPFSSKNCKIQQCLMVFLYRYNMRLKSPCEIASDVMLWFFAFPNLKKANLRLQLNVQKQKVFQLQGALALWPPDQGLCPWTPLGAPPPDPRYRLALRALAMTPLCQILNTPLSTVKANSPVRVAQCVYW